MGNCTLMAFINCLFLRDTRVWVISSRVHQGASWQQTRRDDFISIKECKKRGMATPAAEGVNQSEWGQSPWVEVEQDSVCVCVCGVCGEWVWVLCQKEPVCCLPALLPTTLTLNHISDSSTCLILSLSISFCVVPFLLYFLSSLSCSLPVTITLYKPWDSSLSFQHEPESWSPWFHEHL